MATTVVKYTNTFEDGSNYTLTIGDFDPYKIDSDTIKDGVIELNQNMGTGTYANYPDMLLSKTGAQWRRISRVQLITTNRTYLF